MKTIHSLVEIAMLGPLHKTANQHLNKIQALRDSLKRNPTPANAARIKAQIAAKKAAARTLKNIAHPEGDHVATAAVAKKLGEDLVVNEALKPHEQDHEMEAGNVEVGHLRLLDTLHKSGYKLGGSDDSVGHRATYIQSPSGEHKKVSSRLVRNNMVKHTFATTSESVVPPEYLMLDEQTKPKLIPMGAARHPAAERCHPNHAAWVAARPSNLTKSREDAEAHWNRTKQIDVGSWGADHERTHAAASKLFPGDYVEDTQHVKHTRINMGDKQVAAVHSHISVVHNLKNMGFDQNTLDTMYHGQDEVGESYPVTFYRSPTNHKHIKVAHGHVDNIKKPVSEETIGESFHDPDDDITSADAHAASEHAHGVQTVGAHLAAAKAHRAAAWNSISYKTLGNKHATTQDVIDKHMPHEKHADTHEKLARQIGGPIIHDLSHLDHAEAYDHTQTSAHIHDGDVLDLGRGDVGVMVSAWPTMVKGHSTQFHKLDHASGHTWDTIEGGKYATSAARAHQHSKKTTDAIRGAEALRRAQGAEHARAQGANMSDPTERGPGHHGMHEEIESVTEGAGVGDHVKHVDVDGNEFRCVVDRVKMEGGKRHLSLTPIDKTHKNNSLTGWVPSSKCTKIAKPTNEEVESLDEACPAHDFKKGDKVTKTFTDQEPKPYTATGTIEKIHKTGYPIVNFPGHGSRYNGMHHPSDLKKVNESAELDEANNYKVPGTKMKSSDPFSDGNVRGAVKAGALPNQAERRAEFKAMASADEKRTAGMSDRRVKKAMTSSKPVQKMGKMEKRAFRSNFHDPMDDLYGEFSGGARGRANEEIELDENEVKLLSTYGAAIVKESIDYDSMVHQYNTAAAHAATATRNAERASDSSANGSMGHHIAAVEEHETAVKAHTTAHKAAREVAIMSPHDGSWQEKAAGHLAKIASHKKTIQNHNDRIDA